ncbi:MAG: CocE/NonD family hydrolase [Solirubrobacterales bacterium]
MCRGPGNVRVGRALRPRSTSARTGWATLRWLRAQPWHEGSVGMLGPSRRARPGRSPTSSTPWPPRSRHLSSTA